MELTLLTDRDIEALFDADLVTCNTEDQTPQIDAAVLAELDKGRRSVREIIRFMTAPTMWKFSCPGCGTEVQAIAGTSIVMHNCPKSKPKKGELRLLKRVKEA